MSDFFKKKENIFLMGIAALAAVLRLFRLTRADVVTDAATYSFRSVGFIDVVVSVVQTTPLQWFGYFPWWSRLSFHDHPPLAFIFQHSFFKVFGVNLFAARLPYVIFGILSVIVLYFLIKELYGKLPAMVASLLLAISSYHVWISQSGYIEGILIFFILLSILYWHKALKENKYFIHWSIFFGLATLTKYLAFALIPVFFFTWLLDKKRIEILKSLKVYISIAIYVLIVSPVILYNFMMYKTRGHLDVQFSLLFRQDLSDWPILANQLAGSNYLENIKHIFTTLNLAIPLLFYILFIFGLIYILYELLFKKERKHLIILLTLFFFSIFFTITSPSLRWLSIYVPFIYATIAYFLLKLKNVAPFNKKYIYFPVFIIISLYLLFYSINTNLLYRPIEPEGILYSKSRLENWGYNQLDDWLIEDIGRENLKDIKKVTEHKDIFLINEIYDIANLRGKKLYIYDQTINWFAYLWYFKSKSIYYEIPVLSSDDLIKLYDQFGGDNMDTILNALGPEGIYYIKATDNVLHDSEEYKSGSSDEFEKQIVEYNKLEPIEVIINPMGQEAFRIYLIPHIKE